MIIESSPVINSNCNGIVERATQPTQGMIRTTRSETFRKVGGEG